jgi:hypothetical protein
MLIIETINVIFDRFNALIRIVALALPVHAV